MQYLKQLHESLGVILLGYASGELGINPVGIVVHVGWAEDPLDVMDLGELPTALHSAGFIEDLNIAVDAANFLEPRFELLNALLESPAGVQISKFATVEVEWNIYSRGPRVSEIIVEERALQYARKEILSLGLPYRAISNSMPLSERLKMVGWETALLLEAGTSLPDWDVAENFPKIETAAFLGLATRNSHPSTKTLPSIAWLAFTPAEEDKGSLSSILKDFSQAEINLEYISSSAIDNEAHAFFTAFEILSSENMEDLENRFIAHGVKYRVLAFAEAPGLEKRQRVNKSPIWGETGS